MPERLVREIYFVSPKYKDSFENPKSEKMGVTTRLSAERVPDEKDDFREWLEANTHASSQIGLRHLPSRKLMGENGALCEIVHTDRHVYGESIHTPLGQHGSYYRFVRIISSPFSRDIPPELLVGLENRGYAEANGDDKFTVAYKQERSLSDFFK